MKKFAWQNARSIMLILMIMVLHSLSYGERLSYYGDIPVKQGEDRGGCILLSENLNINICAIYSNVRYGFTLDYAPEVSDLVWKMDSATFRQITLTDTACLYIDNSLALDIPCMTYGTTDYRIKMIYYPNENDFNGLYWKMVEITPIEPDDPEPPPLPEPDFTVTIGEKDGRTIKPLNSVSGGPLAAELDGDVKNADLINEYKELGIKYVRSHDFYGPFDMSEIYSDRAKDPANYDSYNLTRSDHYYEGIAEAQASLYFRLGDSYSNVDPPERSELDNWIDASINVIAHYYDGKWDGYSGGIEYVEIWNEPDNSHFWPDKTLLDFFLLYDSAAKRIREEFPEIKIGGPGFTQNVNMNDDRKSVLEDFLDYITNNNTPIDFISFHQYENDPSQITDAVNSMKTILKEKGFEGLSMHMTEWNTDAEQQGQSMDEKTDLRLNSRGAAINTGTWIEMQNSGIDMAFFFRGNDTNIDMPLFYGLYKADGTPKKTAFAFKFFNQMSEYKERISASIDYNEESDSSVYIIAGQSVAGQRAVLLSNISDKAYTYRLKSIQDGSSGDISREEITSQSEISDDHESIYEIGGQTQGEGLLFNLPGYGVHLIVIQ